MDSGWRLSQRHISRVGVAFVLSPAITNNVCSILSGYYAQQGDVYKADVFARLLYALCTSSFFFFLFWSPYRHYITDKTFHRGFLLHITGFLRHILWSETHAFTRNPSCNVRIWQTLRTSQNWTYEGEVRVYNV